MKITKQPVALWSMAGIILALLTLVTIVCGIHSSPKVLVDPQVITDAAGNTLECVRSGDYEALEQLLYGSPKLGDPLEKTDDAQSILLYAYLDSLEYHTADECYATGSGVALDVHITSLDISALSDALQQIVPDLMQQTARGKEETEIYDGEHNYQPAFISEVLTTAVNQVLAGTPQMVERDITLELVRSGGSWQVVPTESFLQLLTGYVSE